jgi:hypothetical protein
MTWSCSKDDKVTVLPKDEPVAVQFNSNIGNLAIRSSGVKPLAAGSSWAANDAIGVFMVNHSTTTVRDAATNRKYTTSSGGASGNFTPDAGNTVYYPVNGDKVDFISYYPYVASITTLGAYSVDVSDQSTPATIDLLYAKATNSGNGYDKTNTSAVALSFSHQLCKFTLNTSVAGDATQIFAADLTDMTISIAGMNTEASFNLAAGTLGAGSSVAAITPRTATAGAKYEAILLPGSFSGVTVTFVISTGAGAGTYVWNVPDDAFEAGKEYVNDITFTDAGTVSVTGTIVDWVPETGAGHTF